jgi:hypothetical protein
MAKQRTPGKRELLHEGVRLALEWDGQNDYGLILKQLRRRYQLRDNALLPSVRELHLALLQEARLLAPGHEQSMSQLRELAIALMQRLPDWNQRAWGVLLHGGIGPDNSIELLAYLDEAEAVIRFLIDRQIRWREDSKTLSFGKGKSLAFPSFLFEFRNHPVELTVLPHRCLQHPPYDPVSETYTTGCKAKELQRLRREPGDNGETTAAAIDPAV